MNLGCRLPDYVKVSGKKYAIDPSMRTVLKCIRVLNDDDVFPAHRVGAMAGWFYREEVPDEPIGPFTRFAARNSPDDGGEEHPPAIDYDFDSSEITASFRALYGIDLHRDDLHWWEFCELLAGALQTEGSAISERVKLRTADPEKQDERTRKAIEAVQIPTKENAEEKRLSRLISERLKAGLPYDDLLR